MTFSPHIHRNRNTNGGRTEPDFPDRLAQRPLSGHPMPVAVWDGHSSEHCFNAQTFGPAKVILLM